MHAVYNTSQLVLTEVVVPFILFMEVLSKYCVYQLPK